MERTYIDSLGRIFTDTLEGDRLVVRIIEEPGQRTIYRYLPDNESWHKTVEKVDGGLRGKISAIVDHAPDEPSLPLQAEVHNPIR